MSQPTVVLTCPTCERTCRTQRETRPGAKMRCPGCKGVFRFFVHGNGAVELRPVELRPVELRPADDELATESRLPSRSADQDETKGTRTILTSRRRNRPIGGYLPFEKTRSYIGTFAFWTILGLVSLAGYWYINQLEAIGKAQGRKGPNAWNLDIGAKRKEFQARQKKALEKMKKQPIKVQPAVANVENGRLPGDRSPD